MIDNLIIALFVEDIYLTEKVCYDYIETDFRRRFQIQ